MERDQGEIERLRAENAELKQDAEGRDKAESERKAQAGVERQTTGKPLPSIAHSRNERRDPACDEWGRRWSGAGAPACNNFKTCRSGAKRTGSRRLFCPDCFCDLCVECHPVHSHGDPGRQPRQPRRRAQSEKEI